MGIAEARYIRFTNFRRSGEAVSTPVWIAPFGDEGIFSTDADSGKVKRLRNDPRVEVTACDMRGRVSPGTDVVAGTARLLADDEHDAAAAAMKRKYGWQWSMLGVRQSIARLLRRDTARVFVAVTPGDTVRTSPNDLSTRFARSRNRWGASLARGTGWS